MNTAGTEQVDHAETRALEVAIRGEIRFGCDRCGLTVSCCGGW